MSRFVNPVPQFYLNNGDIASAGKLYFYQTGTTTKKDTYSNFGMSVKNTNPVILSGEGRCPNIFGEGRYTVVFKDSDDIEQWTRDDVELSVEIGQYADWSPILTYRVNDIVRGSDGEYYRSITSTNTGNDPTTSATNWERIGFISFWSEGVNYQQDAIVLLNGNVWQSQIDDNLNNNPEQTSTEVWRPISEPSVFISSKIYETGDLVFYVNSIYRSLVDGNQFATPSLSSDWRNIISEFPLVELTGSATTIDSGFNGTYWWQGSGGHTLTIDSQAFDEGATETIIFARGNATSNLTVVAGVGVSLDWSFGGNATGYEIKPEEILRLVKRTGDSYVVYADNGISDTVELGGDFDPGETVLCRRKGNDVSVCATSALTHSSSSSPAASAGIIPAEYRPTSAMNGVSDMFGATASVLQQVTVGFTGSFALQYRDYAGTLTAQTNSGGKAPSVNFSLEN